MKKMKTGKNLKKSKSKIKKKITKQSKNIIKVLRNK